MANEIYDPARAADAGEAIRRIRASGRGSVLDAGGQAALDEIEREINAIGVERSARDVSRAASRMGPGAAPPPTDVIGPTVPFMPLPAAPSPAPATDPFEGINTRRARVPSPDMGDLIAQRRREREDRDRRIAGALTPDYSDMISRARDALGAGAPRAPAAQPPAAARAAARAAAEEPQPAAQRAAPASAVTVARPARTDGAARTIPLVPGEPSPTTGLPRRQRVVETTEGVPGALDLAMQAEPSSRAAHDALIRRSDELREVITPGIVNAREEAARISGEHADELIQIIGGGNEAWGSKFNELNRLVEEQTARAAVDPWRLFRSEETFDRIGLGLSVAAGAVSKAVLLSLGVTTENGALEIIKAAVKEDTELQITEFEQGKDLLGTQLSLMKLLTDKQIDARAAAATIYAAKLGVIAQRLEGIAAMAAGTKEATDAVVLASQLRLTAITALGVGLKAEAGTQEVRDVYEVPTAERVPAGERPVATPSDAWLNIDRRNHPDSSGRDRQNRWDRLPPREQQRWHSAAAVSTSETVGGRQRAGSALGASSENWNRLSSNAQDEQIANLSKRLQQYGIATTAFRGLQEKIKEHNGEIDNTGQLSRFVPAFFMSEEGRNFRQDLYQAYRAYIYATSGKQINEKEAADVRKTLGLAGGYTTESIEHGVRLILRTLGETSEVTFAGANPNAIVAFHARNPNVAPQHTIQQAQIQLMNEHEAAARTMDLPELVPPYGVDRERWEVKWDEVMSDENPPPEITDPADQQEWRDSDNLQHLQAKFAPQVRAAVIRLLGVTGTRSAGAAAPTPTAPPAPGAAPPTGAAPRAPRIRRYAR